MSVATLKVFSIYIDIRNSSNLSLKDKKETYSALYKQFSDYGENLNDLELKHNSLIGDGVLMIFKNKKAKINEIKENNKNFLGFLEKIKNKNKKY